MTLKVFFILQQMYILHEPWGNIRNVVIKNSLDQVFQWSLNHVNNPVLEECVNKVNKDFKDPIQRAKTRNIYINVPNMGDRKISELKTTSIDYIHLSISNICCNTSINRYSHKFSLGIIMSTGSINTDIGCQPNIVSIYTQACVSSSGNC